MSRLDEVTRDHNGCDEEIEKVMSLTDSAEVIDRAVFRRICAELAIMNQTLAIIADRLSEGKQ